MIQVTWSFANAAEAARFLAGQPGTGSAAVATSTAVAADPTPAPAKPRRGRPPAAAPAPAPAGGGLDLFGQTQAAPANPVGLDLGLGAGQAQAAEAPLTQQEVFEALIAYKAKHGDDKTLQLLVNVAGVKSAKLIPEAKYDAVYDAATA